MAAAAQAVYGSLSGSITDNSGGALPGVTVTIKSVERNTVDTVVTNESGIYSKDRLLPGTYEVKAELAGFKAAVVPRVTVSVDTQTPVNFKLEVGAVSEEVTVSGGAPLLKTDRADVATRFDAKELTELPVLDRNFTKFILLTPGAQQMGWQHAASENPQGSTQTQINGQHFSGTGYQLDGTENRDPILGIIVVNPTLESIGESKITSQNYDAEFGQATAGVVSVQTKSGANELHGSGFEFFQNEALQARNPFTQSRVNPLTGKFIPDTTKNQFGGSVGGPITQNKWFFFGDYQGTRQDQGGSRLLSVPTARRARATSASTASRSSTRLTGAASSRTRPFPNRGSRRRRSSSSTSSRCRTRPAPRTAPATTTSASGVENFTENSFNTRIDGRLSDKMNTFGRYARQVQPDGRGALGIAGGPQFVGIAGVSESRNQSLAYGIDTPCRRRCWSTSASAGSSTKVDVLPADFGTTPAADAGIPNLNNDDDLHQRPARAFMRGNQADMNWGYGPRRQRLQLSARPRTRSSGRWSATSPRSGATTPARRASTCAAPTTSACPPIGIARASSTSTRCARATPASAASASPTFLLGDVDARLVRPLRQRQHRARERQWRHFYYAQDTWRANTEADAELRPASRHHQPADGQRGRQRRLVDLATGLGPRRRRGRHRSRRQRREPPELGAAPRRDLSVERQDGDPRRLRPQLRHRRLRLALRPHASRRTCRCWRRRT